jgi:hypothetical protein
MSLKDWLKWKKSGTKVNIKETNEADNESCPAMVGYIKP